MAVLESASVPIKGSSELHESTTPLWSAFRVGLMGFVSAAVVAATASMRGWPFANMTAEPWFFQLMSSSVVVRYTFVILFYAGIAGLCWAWIQALRLAHASRISVRNVVVLFALWALPFAFQVPMFSGDVYVYYVDGQALNRGYSVYDSGIAALGPEPIVYVVHPIWRDTKTMYGPLFMQMAESVARLTDGHMLAGVLVFRAIALASIAVMAWGVVTLCRKLNRSVVAGLAFALLNPVTVLHLFSGAHNDATMIGLLMAGLAIGASAQSWPLRTIAIALCTAGAAFKVPAFVGVLLLGWVWAGEGVSIIRRMIVSAIAGAVGVFFLHLYGVVTGLGWGWTKATDVPGMAHPILAPANAIAFGFGGPFNVHYGINSVTRPLALAITLGVCAWLILRTGKNAQIDSVLRAGGWALLVLAWMGPAVYPWYLAWGVVLLGALGAGRFQKFLIVMTIVACLAVAPGGYGWLDNWGDWRRTVLALCWTATFVFGACWLFKNRADRTASPTTAQPASTPQ